VITSNRKIICENSFTDHFIRANGLTSNRIDTNTAVKPTDCRVRVNTITGQAVGPYEVISKGVLADDFAISLRKPTGRIDIVNVITQHLHPIDS
jgi:hypothetical protein